MTTGGFCDAYWRLRSLWWSSARQKRLGGQPGQQSWSKERIAGQSPCLEQRPGVEWEAKRKERSSLLLLPKGSQPSLGRTVCEANHAHGSALSRQKLREAFKKRLFFCVAFIFLWKPHSVQFPVLEVSPPWCDARVSGGNNSPTHCEFQEIFQKFSDVNLERMKIYLNP